jgi:tetratricopeptide (TPR) repeat protein
MSERAKDSAADFDHALGLHQAGRHGEALDAYRKILAGDPKHAGALTCSGVVLLEQGKTKEAVEILQESVALEPNGAAANAFLANALQVLGRLEDAEDHYRRALETAPDDARTLNNFGVLLRRLNRLEKAETSFRRAIEIQPDYTEALINHGEVLIALGRQEEAINAFRRATATAPREASAWLKLGRALSLANRHKAALEAIDQAVQCNPSDPRAHHARGRCLKALGRPEAAATAYRSSLALAPDHHEARHNLGVALRISGRPDEAIACYREVLERQPNRVATQFNLGNALLDLGDVKNAMRAYRATIALRPDHLGAHRALNDLYWQQGRTDDYARSYDDAIRRAPQSIELRQHHARQLELVGSIAQAEHVLRTAVRDLGEQPSFSHRLAVIAGRRGMVGEAVEHFDAAISMAPAMELYRQDYVVLLLTSGDYDEAGAQLDAWERLGPDDLAMWAYRGLLWQITGDERASWLNDYDRFVRPILLEPPASHGSLEGFLSDLAETLTALHPTAAHPLEQTLRGGTQTPGELFNRREPIIQALRQQIEKAVCSYIDSLPDDPDHPFLRRKAGRFAFSGSWSVCLKSDGFHVNHVHTKGWISSACYIELPDAMKSATESDKSGWIRFGQSPLDLGEQDVVARWVRPEEGVLVLFPSYTWHGTEAFASDAVRMTVAFDMVPA